MAVILRQGIRSASVVGDEGSLGRVISSPIRRDLDALSYETSALGGRARQYAEPHVLQTVAGVAAEARFAGLRAAALWAGNASAHDRFVAGQYCRLFLTDAEVAPYVAWLTTRAAAILGRPGAWLQVTAVAQALLAQGTLSGFQIRGACADAIQAELALRSTRQTPPRGRTRTP